MHNKILEVFQGSSIKQGMLLNITSAIVEYRIGGILKTIELFQLSSLYTRLVRAFLALGILGAAEVKRQTVSEEVRSSTFF